MTAAATTPARSDPKSTFVTVVAWIFVVLSALSLLGSLASVLILTVTPAATLNATVNRLAQDTTVINLLPAPYRFMMHHVYLVAVLKLIWWAAVLIASVGVLRRREWGRRAFVVVLGVQILQMIVGFLMGQSIGMSLARQLASRSPSGRVPPGMGTGLALGGLLGVAVIAILVWLFLSFRSARVREEFASATRAA